MGFWSNLLNRPQLPPAWTDGWQAGLGAYGDVKKGSIGGIAALNSALRILNGQLTATPLLVFRGTTETPESPAGRMLANTRAQDFEAAYYDALTTGNGWLYIDRANNCLEHIQAFRMGANLVDYKVRYVCDGKEIVYSDWVHIMFRNSYSRYLGESLISQNDTSVGAIMSIYALQSQLSSNASHAEVYLKTDMSLNGVQMQQLRESYDRQAAAQQGKLGGVLLLSNGMTPVVARSLPTALESDIIKSLNFATEEVVRLTGVPAHWLGLSGQVNYNSAIEASRDFHRVVMQPMYAKVASELSFKLGEKVRFDTSSIQLGMGVERAEVLSKLLYSGSISVNEARSELGYSGVPHGDNLGMPVNSIPLNSWVDTQPHTSTNAPASAESPSKKSLDNFLSLIGM